jgi:hypothetical protein
MQATGIRQRLLLLAVAGVLAGDGFAGDALGVKRAPSCTIGVRTVGGATVRTFCGPAKATARTGGTTFTFSGGQCAVSQGYFTVNIGSITLPPHKAKFSYLGIDVKPARAGAHRNQIVSWQVPGKGYSILGATVTVGAGLKSGTFAGRLTSGGTATGSFGCS